MLASVAVSIVTFVRGNRRDMTYGNVIVKVLPLR